MKQPTDDPVIAKLVEVSKDLGHHPRDPRLNPDIYKQKVPCNDCPFRKEGGVRHEPEILASYIAHFTEPAGVTFPCHKSVDDGDTRETWSEWQYGQVLCAGGLLFATKQGKANGVMRYGMACGWYDPAEHSAEALATVFDSAEEMLKDAPDGPAPAAKPEFLECPCCGHEGAYPRADGFYYDGDALACASSGKWPWSRRPR